MTQAGETHFEMYQSKSQDGLRMEWRWRLVHRNGRIIADSGEGYFKKSDCENGIDLVKRSSSSEVKHETRAEKIVRTINDQS